MVMKRGYCERYGGSLAFAVGVTRVVVGPFHHSPIPGCGRHAVQPCWLSAAATRCAESGADPQVNLHSVVKDRVGAPM